MIKKAIMCAALGIGLCAQAESDVEWLKTTHDFGAFDENTKAKTACFSFVNTGDEPVAVISATATCGCTTPKYPKEATAPGDTCVIEVSYDPSGRPGRFNKQVYVRTSASPERTKLTLQGTVIGDPETIAGRYPVSMGPLKLRTGSAMMGRAYAGQGKMHYVDGYNQSADTLRVQIVEKPPYLDIKSVPEAVAPGEMLTLDFELLPGVTDLWGVVTDTVMISPTLALDPFPYQIVLIMEEDFSQLTPQELAEAPVAKLSTDRLLLDAIPEGAETPVSTTVTLTNGGKRPLTVHRVYSEDPGVKVHARANTVGSGSSTGIDVEYDPKGQPTGVVNARFIVITNDPQRPTQTVRIVAGREPKEQ